MPRPPSLDQLRIFSDVVASGSISATAARHNVSQPAVSFQVKQLEKRLGVRLLERIGRKVMPTAAGIELVEHVGRIKREIDAALDAMERRATGKFGRVRLGTGATACIFLLPPILRDLRERFPDLDMSIATGNTLQIVKAVEENDLDIALVTLPAYGRMLSVETILQDEFLVVAPPGTKLPASVTPSCLKSLPLIHFEASGNSRRLVDQWLVENELESQSVMSLDSIEAIKKLVEAGLGYAILPGMALPPAHEASAFVVRPLEPKLHRELAIVIRKDKILHRGLREVLVALKGLSNPPCG